MLRQRTIIQVGHRKHPLLYKQEHTYLIWDVNGWHSTYLLDLINQKYSVTQVHNNGHRFPPKHCRRCQKIQTLSDYQLLTCISQSTKDLIRPNYPDIGLFSESSIIEENTCLFLTAIADHRQPMWMGANIVQNFKDKPDNNEMKYDQDKRIWIQLFCLFPIFNFQFLIFYCSTWHTTTLQKV